MTKLTPLDIIMLQRIGLREAEAALVCEALEGLPLSLRPEVVWREVDLAIKESGLASKWEVDGEGLVQHLRRLGQADTMALMRAVNRFWEMPDMMPAQRLRAAGFIP
ncbi:MAG: hypothetical protein ACREQN_05590 [Candidatus Binataceae bacterium]